MLWDDLNGRLVVIDFEDVRWLKRSSAPQPTSGNIWRGHRIRRQKETKAPVQLGFRLHMTSTNPSTEVVELVISAGGQ